MPSAMSSADTVHRFTFNLSMIPFSLRRATVRRSPSVVACDAAPDDRRGRR
jgi:hypothetical protein